MKLYDYILNAQKTKRAMWHFNIGSLEQWKGIIEAVRVTKEPLIVATSEGESSYISSSLLRTLVDDAQQEGLPIFLGADHRKSKKMVEEAISGNVDVVVLDASNTSYDENVLYVKAMSKLCKDTKPEMLTEGELGFIGASSEIHGTFDKSYIKNLPGVEMINKFIDATGVNLIAPALGTVHGIVEGGNPHIDIKHIQDICAGVKVPVVLHGGSGLSMNVLKQIRASGVAVIHINTDIRLVMKESLARALTDVSDVAPYKYLNVVVDSISKKIQEFIAL